MKRDSSEIEPPSPISSESDDFKPGIKPPTSSTNKKVKDRSVPSTPSAKKQRTKKEVGQKGEWTPEKKGVFMDRIIAAGYKAANIGELAIDVSYPLEGLTKSLMCYQLGMSKTQLENQLNVGRKGSLREKAVQAAKGT